LLALFSSGLLALWFTTTGLANPAKLLAEWQDTPLILSDQGTPDPIAQATMQQYLQGLTKTGLRETGQGIWLQSGFSFLASHQGTTPLPAASLTKVATSLAALQTWGPDHQFTTLISTTGLVQNGVLKGDLIVQGGGDPLMVWEEAIALGNDLHRAGITKVTGNLVIAGNFLMNFETDRQKAGELFKQALNAKAWSAEIEEQYQILPKGTPRPQVAIAGTVQVVADGGFNANVLLRHRSLPLSRILKLMNVYSNNVIADALANAAGGAPMVAQTAAAAAGVPVQEVLLKSGSGLGVENRISPRAICSMFATLQRDLQPYGLTIADIFPISGIDPGTIEGRKIPEAAVVKTGTLNDVSALAGVLPTRDRRLVWFAIINRGTNLDGLRHQQDNLLQNLVKQWGFAPSIPTAITPSSTAATVGADLGDARRNDLLGSAVEVNTYQGN